MKIITPYRVCPLGAHIDHQHGVVTGFAIEKCAIDEPILVVAGDNLTDFLLKGFVEYSSPGFASRVRCTRI